MRETALDRLISAWVRVRGGLEPTSEDGVYAFVFDGAHEVELSQDGSQILFRSEIGDCPTQTMAAETAMERLMAVQLGLVFETPATLSLDDTAGAFVIHAEVEPPADVTSFDALFGAFVNAVALFTRELAALAAVEARTPATRFAPMFP